MSTRSDSRASFDSSSPITPQGGRDEFPFFRQGSSSARRGSNASSVRSGSVGGILDTSRGGSNVVAESGHNAISTLLQAPIIRTGLLPHVTAPSSASSRLPTSRDIPPVTLTNIRHVEQSEFRSYISQVGPLYDQLGRAKEQEESTADVLQRKGSKIDVGIDTLEEGRLRPGRQRVRKTSISSLTALSPIEAPSPVRRSSSNFNRRAHQGPPPLSTIPVVYFDDDFHLENPRTFDIVSEKSEIIQQPSNGSANGNASAPRKALATNAILQEKLSWYMDTVEMHLISSISTASTTFFGALGSLKDLHTEAAESVQYINAIRDELRGMDRDVVTAGLDLVEKRRTRENLEQLQDTILQLKEVVERLAACESLADEGESDQALNRIESLEKFVAGEDKDASSTSSHTTTTTTNTNQRKGKIRDLSGAAALQGIGDDIAALRARIGKACEARFVSCLISDLRRHVEDVSTQDVLKRWDHASTRSRPGHKRETSASAYPSYFSSTDGLRAELTESLTTLYRADSIASAATIYRETALKDIRNLVRKPLPSSTDDDNESIRSSSTLTGGKRRTQQEKSATLTRNLRALEPEDAEQMLIKIYVSITETMRRITTQVKLLLDVASCIQTSSDDVASHITSPLKSPPEKASPFSPGPGSRRPSQAVLEAQEEIHKALDLGTLLGEAVDIAQDYVVRLLGTRSAQSTHLELVRFLRYFTLNLHFANECESISGRSGLALKNTVNGHIKGFVQQHGDGEKQKLAQHMESDKWDAVDFGEKESKRLQDIVDSSTSDPAVWQTGTALWLPLDDNEADKTSNDLTTPKTNGTGGKPKIRNATIDEESFVLPDSAVACMKGMSSFLHLVVGIPSVTGDVSSSLIAYLQLFNSRCTQLILGAGATKSAGLKNITTKHLALASQALAFIAALIPHIREFIRRHAGTGGNVSSLMSEFDKVKRLFQEHQNSIYEKLVDIMSGRAGSHCRALKMINWSEKTSEGESAPHPYMETLAKETLTLHKTLVKHLPEGTVRLIMVPVFGSYKEQFGAVFRDLDPGTEDGRTSMLRDIDFLETKLGRIDGFDDVSQHLRAIVKDKHIAAPTPTPAAVAPSQPAANTATDNTETQRQQSAPDEAPAPVPVATGTPQADSSTTNNSAAGEKPTLTDTASDTK